MLGPGITSPKIEGPPAVYPSETIGAASRRDSLLGLLVGADGAQANLHVIHSAGDAFDDAAMEAVRQSKFEPGFLGAQTIPVWIYLLVRFSADRSPAIPEIFQQKVDIPPKVIHLADSEYPEEARRKNIQGIVIVSGWLTAEGLPTEIRVAKSLGYGLDENAMQAFGQGRFKPAMKDGKPIATQITIEMEFRLSHPRHWPLTR